ncbi:ribonuclease Z [Candidatus Woesearchaeota archaeon]|nr:ribonuclease Z [Candidatus Woesearchaeota archaeon]
MNRIHVCLMQIVFLGTSCMVPTKERNVSSVFLSHKNEGILFDCGEGTQRQMNIAGIKRTKVTKIFISHWHGDHVSGIIGLLQTMGNDEDPPKVEIFGPKGTMDHMKGLMNACVFEARVDLKVHELDPKNIERCIETPEFYVECGYLNHTTHCLGYSFIEKDRRRIKVDALKKLGIREGPHLKKLQSGKDIDYKAKKIKADDVTYIVKGKKITYIMDSRPCNMSVELAKNADVLISECAYADDLQDKARKYKHLTAGEAAMIARNADAKKLYLTHFSQRYKDTQQICEDATSTFPNTVCAEDFMKITL